MILSIYEATPPEGLKLYSHIFNFGNSVLVADVALPIDVNHKTASHPVRVFVLSAQLKRVRADSKPVVPPIDTLIVVWQFTCHNFLVYSLSVMCKHNDGK